MGSSPENPQNFRAPPPSPIANASGRRSIVINDDEFTEFLEKSLRIPELILPDRIFPQQISIENPPEIDLLALTSPESSSTTSKILESISQIGCFQLLNHGISDDLIRSVLRAAAGVFRIPSDHKAIVSRSSEKRYGFEEFFSEEETDMSEEFIWCKDEGLKSVMEGIWTDGFSNFSKEMESLYEEIEKVANKILRTLLENILKNTTNEAEEVQGSEHFGSICCLYKHCRNTPPDRWVGSLKSDVIRMLLRESEYSHALSVHLCDGSSDSEFHVYSKKGWISFSPSKEAVVVTVGDQIQACSGGKYKHVIGRPIFKGEDVDAISMAFLYSSPPSTIIQSQRQIHSQSQSLEGNRKNTISIGQQAVLAIFLTLLSHFLVYIYNNY